MENHIRYSLDWPVVQTVIEAPVRNLKKYNDQMRKISKNIAKMVNELSKEEIACRRYGRQTQRHKEMLDKINKEITNYERMVTFAALISD